MCLNHAGNMVEWCLPHDINLDGVEFKSMASGSHRITNDFMWVHPPSLPPTIQVKCTMSKLRWLICVTVLHLCFVPFASYFRKGCYFGLACFANMPVESELERGARMKSVGILCPSYTLLYRYMHFLENQVRLDTLCIACVPIASVPSYLYSVYLMTQPSLQCAHLLSLLLCSNVVSSIKHEQRDPVTAILIHTRFLC